MSKKNGLGKFLAGIGIGAGLGLLFAPKKGEELRRDLKNTLDNIMSKVKDLDIEEVKDAVSDKIDDIKISLAELDKETVLEKAKEAVAKIQEKANDLVAYAKEKGTPVLEKMANEAKDKAIEVTKDVLKKLEKSKKISGN